MPFGSYKGTPIEKLPRQYLDWLLGQDWLREPLLTFCRDEVARREATPTPSDDEVKKVALEIVTTGYRRLSQQRHPDTGGSHEAMVTLNKAHSWLKERVGV